MIVKVVWETDGPESTTLNGTIEIPEGIALCEKDPIEWLKNKFGWVILTYEVEEIKDEINY